MISSVFFQWPVKKWRIWQILNFLACQGKSSHAAKLCCALAHGDFVFFRSSDAAKHYAYCKPHISLPGYSLSLPATAKHYATCQFQISVIGYSLTEQWMLCVLLTINYRYERTVRLYTRVRCIFECLIIFVEHDCLKLCEILLLDVLLA